MIFRESRFRNCIWENFPDSVEFQGLKGNFKTEKSSKSADPHLTMHWIKGVEIAKSIDEIMTSRSIVERNDFPDCDMVDAMIASALKRLRDKHIHFRRSKSVEEQRAQKMRPILRRETKSLHDLRAFPCNWSC